jgi:hypothetical protein
MGSGLRQLNPVGGKVCVDLGSKASVHLKPHPKALAHTPLTYTSEGVGRP